MPDLTHIAAAVDRHERIAFQFSGGKDSTAALHLMRPWWPRMTVYWLDSGDAFPETAAFVGKMVSDMPHFVKVPGRVKEAIASFGIPADVISERASEPAWAMSVGAGARLQDRSLCCWRSKMAPLHQRMVDDGITLIVRGQKDADTFRGPLHSGDVVDGTEVLYPLEQWSSTDVFAYLMEHDIMPPLYEHGLKRSGDCMRCSAWLGDLRATYLAEHHPQAFAEYRARIRTIAMTVDRSVKRLFEEVVTVSELELARGAS